MDKHISEEQRLARGRTGLPDSPLFRIRSALWQLRTELDLLEDEISALLGEDE